MKVSLETERLLLRPFHLDDHEAYASINADPEVMRHTLDGHPLSQGDSFRVLSMILGHWELRGYGMWAMEHKTNGEMIGHVGFWYPPDWPGVELCYRLHRGYWGKGLATEGARRAQAFGFDQLGLGAMVSVIHPENAASLRVAEKLGMAFKKPFEHGAFCADIYHCSRSV